MLIGVHPYVMAGAAVAGASLIAVTPVAPPPDLDRVASAAVRLTAGFDDLLGGLDLGGIENIPYNLFADVVNIPYYESLALQEYAYALGPAGQVGGVPDWIPPGATVENGGAVLNAAGQELYAIGGTGSWYMQSIGNTWGWDDGNWPQLAAISHFLFPFQFELPIAQQLQGFAQAEFIDGARVNCEFECASILGYLGGWARGETPLTELLSPNYTFPETLVSTIQDSSTGIINEGPTWPFAIWANQPGNLDPLAPFEAIVTNLTQDPGSNPLQFPDLGSVFTNVVKLVEDTITNFNPFVQGSFLYWGAPTAYSVPSLLGGTLQDLTGIPNQFGFPLDQMYGAEPVWGYTAGPSELLTGIPKAFEYLLNGPGGPVTAVGGTGGDGLLGYLNPETYLTAFDNLLNGQFPAVLDLVPGLGYLGLPQPGDLLESLVDSSTLSTDLSGLLGSTGATLPIDLSELLGSTGATLPIDLSELLGSTGATLPTDLSGLLGFIGGTLPTDLAALLGTALPSAATSMGTLLGTDLASMIPSLLTSFL